MSVPEKCAAILAARPRTVIFVLALGLRLLAGYLFFGSVDVANSVAGSLTLLDGKPYPLPYFPLINALIWFGGVLAAALPLPLALAVKLGPILFDSLLAVLIHDLVSPKGAGFRAGLLYAFSPLALLNVSFHGQWDAIAVFFLMLAFAIRRNQGTRTEFLFGAWFAFSLLVKPIALPFLLLFARRGDRRPSWASAGGFVMVAMTACGIAQFYGYAPLDILVRVAGYSSRGIQIFGLPFAPVLNGLPLLKFRLLWMVPAALAIAIYYHRGRFNWAEAMLLFYLCSLATSGLSPQYLLWPLPFMLVSGRGRAAALYSGVTTIFLLLFYANPWASFVPFENLTTFIPLRSVAWLAPPSQMMTRQLLPLLKLLGTLVVPCTALLIGLRVLMQPSAGEETSASVPTVWYAAPGLLVFILIGFTKCLLTVAPVRERLVNILKIQPQLYAMHLHWQAAALFVGDNVGDKLETSPFNVVFLLVGLALAWSGIAAGCKLTLSEKLNQDRAVTAETHDLTVN